MNLPELMSTEKKLFTLGAHFVPVGGIYPFFARCISGLSGSLVAACAAAPSTLVHP